MRKFLSLFTVLVLCNVLAFAQTRVVTGKVTDDQGQPIPFASIRVKGNKSGTSADAEGNFTLRAASTETLIVSGTGVTEKSIVVGTEDPLRITVSRTQSALTEVVVTSLGVQRQAKQLGYSTAKVTAKEINQAKPISAVNGLTGKVSGLQINTVNNGVFADTRVTLRGNRSLTGNNQPLYVVDGAIYYNDINTINPDDITDIVVLKGSSAAAVYGSDASNGVILVTTRKGNRVKPTINISSTIQREAVSYLPATQTRFGADGGERFINDYNDLSNMVPYENQAYGPEFQPGKFTPIGRPVADGTHQTVEYAPVKNQKRDFYDKAITTQNNFSYASGDATSRLLISAQDITTRGVVPGDKGKRDAFRVAGSKQYGKFTTDFSVGYTYKRTDLTSDPGGVYDNLLNTPANIPLKNYKDWKNNKFADLNGYYNDYYDNPYWAAANNRSITNDHNLTGNIHAQLKPVSWLTLSYRVGATLLSRTNEQKNSDKNYSSFASSYDTVLYSTPDGSGVDSVPESSKYNASLGNQQANYTTAQYTNLLITSDFLASFSHDFGKDFNLNLNVGTSYMNNRISGQIINAGPLFFPVYNVNSLTGIPNIGNENLEAHKLGYFGDATIGFRNFAFLHGSYRTDVDSRLSKENRYIPYYDIDASLVISDLFPNINNGKIVNFVKIRAAHSVTGNVSALGRGSSYIADGAYATVNTLQSASPNAGIGLGFPYNGIGGYYLNHTIANPNIKPETVTENEIGLEFGLLQNRLSLTLAGFRSKLTDGIVYAQIPTSSGYSSALINAANTQNTGFESELSADIVKTKNVTWRVGVNYTHIISKVVRINGDQTSIGISPAVDQFRYAGQQGSGTNANSYAILGQPFPVLQSYDWVRDEQGRVIVDAVTGYPSKGSSLKNLGQVNPKDVLGITTGLTVKNFSINVTADYRSGYVIYNSIGNTIDFSGNGATTAAAGRQRFVFPNSVIRVDGKSVPNANVTVQDGNSSFWPSQYNAVGANYVVSAAAWKLREVSLSYQFPKAWISPAPFISDASLTISGRNLIMIRPSTNKWTDPEFNEGTGNDVGRNSLSQTPPTRIISATLSFTF